MSLIGVLALAVGAELLTNRIGARLLREELLLPIRALRAIDLAGLFFFYFASALSVLVGGVALARLLAQPVPAHAPGASTGKAITLVALAGFVTIAALGVVRQLPDRLLVYLLTLFTYLVLQFALAAFPGASGRLRLWLSLLVVGVALHSAWVIARVFHVVGSPYPRLSLQLGEAVAVTLGASAPFCLLPGGTLLALPLVIGALATGGALGMGLGSWPLAAHIADGVFGLELPEPAVGVVLFALGLGGFAMAATALLLRPGTSRLRGFGLLVIGLSGYQLELPFQVASTLVGLLAIVESVLREEVQGLDVEAWKAIARRAAAAVGACEVVMAGRRGHEEVQARAILDGEAVELVVRCSAGQLALVELAAGAAPANEGPPLSLQARSGPRLGRRAGEEVQTGDTAFDAAFAIYDERRLNGSDPLLADDLRPRMRLAEIGWLGVWPGQGARLRTASPRLLECLSGPDGSEAVRELAVLLVELKRR